MKELRQNKDFRVFCWTVFNALVAFIIAYCSTENYVESSLLTGLLIPCLNALTKFVNVKFFGDLGVKKD